MSAKARMAGERERLSRTRAPCNFRRRDVRAAVEAIEAAGQKVGRVEFKPGGGFSVFVSADRTEAELDAELRQFEAAQNVR